MKQSGGRNNVRPQPWLSEGTCKGFSLLATSYLLSLVLSPFLFLKQILHLKWKLEVDSTS